jgi:hypothetical protein
LNQRDDRVRELLAQLAVPAGERFAHRGGVLGMQRVIGHGPAASPPRGALVVGERRTLRA